MGKKVFAELDEVTFNRIKNCKNTSGMLDEKKFFNKLKEGDSVIFSCRDKKIEAYLKNIKIYNSISEYLKNNDVAVLEINSRTPLSLLSKMSTIIGDNGDKTGTNEKRVKIYEVDYHPYGEDDEDENNNDTGPHQNINQFIEALISGPFTTSSNPFFKNNYDDDEF